MLYCIYRPLGNDILKRRVKKRMEYYIYKKSPQRALYFKCACVSVDNPVCVHLQYKHTMLMAKSISLHVSICSSDAFVLAHAVCFQPIVYGVDCALILQYCLYFPKLLPSLHSRINLLPSIPTHFYVLI